MAVFLAPVTLVALSIAVGLTKANIRCISCAPCEEVPLIWSSNSLQQDCYLDRMCLKISGTLTDFYGYRRELTFRGCPYLSLVQPNLQEGCSSAAFEVPGLGRLEGRGCLCRGDLCNSAIKNKKVLSSTTVMAGAIFIAALSWY